jgi:transposase-like protein
MCGVPCLVELAGVLAQHPTAALPEACGDGAMLKAAYRFLANDAIAP